MIEDGHARILEPQGIRERSCMCMEHIQAIRIQMRQVQNKKASSSLSWQRM